MSDTRPTPETDAAWGSWPYAGPGVHANFARKLERERDEAREAKERITKRAEAMREAIKTASDAIALQIFVRGTRDDTLDVLLQMQAAQTKLQSVIIRTLP